MEIGANPRVSMLYNLLVDVLICGDYSPAPAGP